MWDEKTAQDYDLINTAVLSYEDTQRNTVDEVVRYVSRRGIKRPRILEIGCGTGNTTQFLLDKLPKVDLTCVDSSKDMIAVAQSRFADKNVKLINRDGLEYLGRYWNYSLDAVVTAQTLHNIPQNERAIYYSEISRVLKVGGVFIDGDKFAVDNLRQHNKIFSAQLVNIGLVLGSAKRSDLAIKLTEHYLEDNHPDIIFYESEFMEKCREFGMKPRISHRVHMDAVGVAIKYSLK